MLYQNVDLIKFVNQKLAKCAMENIIDYRFRFVCHARANYELLNFVVAEESRVKDLLFRNGTSTKAFYVRVNEENSAVYLGTYQNMH